MFNLFVVAVVFVLGVYAGLSWPKIKSYLTKQEAKAVADAKAEAGKVADDIKAKL